jgi:hypothetical protein
MPWPLRYRIDPDFRWHLPEVVRYHMKVSYRAQTGPRGMGPQALPRVRRRLGRA